MRQAIVDASVILKWYLPDEEHSHVALKLLDSYVTDRLTILAPALLEYEVINGLLIARRRGRVEEEKLVLAIEGFFALGIPLKTIAPLYPQVLHYCKTYDCSAYDASYLALADHEEYVLVTADEKLYRATAKDLSWVKWLGDEQLFHD